jgi:membrane-associated protein
MDLFDPKSLIETFGTIGLILIIFAESGLLLGLVFPGDSLLFTAGLLAASDKFGLNIFVVAGGVFVAAVVGSQVGYWLGRRYGPSMFSRPDSRIFKREYVDQSREFFDKHGAKTIVLARFVPFVRTLAPMMAGIGDMDGRTFFAFNVLGAGLWALGVSLAGYFLGSTIPDIDKYLLPIIGLIIVISLIPPALEYRKHKRLHRESHELNAAEAEELSADLHQVVDD